MVTTITFYIIEIFIILFLLSQFELIKADKKELMISILLYIIAHCLVSLLSVNTTFFLFIKYLLQVIITIVMTAYVSKDRYESIFYASSVIFIMKLMDWLLLYVRFIYFADLPLIIILLMKLLYLLSIIIIIFMNKYDFINYSYKGFVFNFIMLILLITLTSFYQVINILIIPVICVTLFVIWVIIHKLFVILKY